MSSVKAFKWCWLAIILLQYWYNESYSYPLIVPNEKIYFLDSHGLRRELADKLDIWPTTLHAAFKVNNNRGIAHKRDEDYLVHNTEHENSNHIDMERGPTAYQEPDPYGPHTQVVRREHYQPTARIQNGNVEKPSKSDNTQISYDNDVPLVMPLSEEDRSNFQVSERQNCRTCSDVDNNIVLPSEVYGKQALNDLALRIKQMIFQDYIESDSNNRNPIDRFSD